MSYQPQYPQPSYGAPPPQGYYPPPQQGYYPPQPGYEPQPQYAPQPPQEQKSSGGGKGCLGAW
ncbi:hypothetical protein N7492_001538 [Penicillium capsulatum]|uniref:Cysteine-rich transmembrane CYSTM domain-containing protein n=1 Tax=Penicillium capsulatum TaxID=69766 RepID=A0A9W9M184_9EURO|nr:hypothetical protein N7492_001538 [Penicillium capsulatum]KAJ6129409.1 hypothetical protein N7512_002189 [Penicillium capsulatum]